MFGDMPSIPIGLRPNEDILTQLERLEYSLLGCKVGSVWRVHKNIGKIKRMVTYADYQLTPARLFDTRRVNRKPDYLLVVPHNAPLYNVSSLSSMSGGEKLGLVRVTVVHETGMHSRVYLIRKASLEDFISEEERRLERKGYVEVDQKESFLTDWNDYCVLIFE